MVGNFHNHKIYGTIESKVPSQLWEKMEIVRSSFSHFLFFKAREEIFFFSKSLSRTSSLVSLDFSSSLKVLEITVGEEMFFFWKVFFTNRHGFWFLVCCTAVQLALQLHQERIQVVRSNRAAPEAPGPRALPQWTLDLKSYAQADIHTK